MSRTVKNRRVINEVVRAEARVRQPSKIVPQAKGTVAGTRLNNKRPVLLLYIKVPYGNPVVRALASIPIAKIKIVASRRKNFLRGSHFQSATATGTNSVSTNNVETIAKSPEKGMVTVKKAATHSMICSKTKARNV
jgi:hypothetical protein